MQLREGGNLIWEYTKGQASGFLQRLDKEKLDVAVYNAETEANAEMWILGTENGLSNNDIYQEKLNEPSPENIKAAANFIDTALELKKLADLATKHGFNSEPVKTRLAELKTKPHINSDKGFQKILQQIEGKIQF